MKQLINVNFEKLATKLLKKNSVDELAYQCGVGSHTIRRIADGTTTKVDHNCGQLMLSLNGWKA